MPRLKSEETYRVQEVACHQHHVEQILDLLIRRQLCKQNNGVLGPLSNGHIFCCAVVTFSGAEHGFDRRLQEAHVGLEFGLEMHALDTETIAKKIRKRLQSHTLR